MPTVLLRVDGDLALRLRQLTKRHKLARVSDTLRVLLQNFPGA